ncbi:hypothetical protein BH23CHL2_BH23CHL2_35110 [soil metagenome]
MQCHERGNQAAQLVGRKAVDRCTKVVGFVMNDDVTRCGQLEVAFEQIGPGADAVGERE